MSRIRGFTLIELIAVILIVGIIAAVAVPRFVDLSEAARQGTVEGIAGNLASASALNLAAGIAQDQNPPLSLPPGLPRLVSGCDDAPDLLRSGELPDGYSVSDGPGYPSDPEHREAVPCTLSDDNDSSISVDFTLYLVDPAL